MKKIKKLLRHSFLALALCHSSLVLSQEIDLSGLEDELLSIERSQMLNVEAIDQLSLDEDEKDPLLSNDYIADEVSSGLAGLKKVNSLQEDLPAPKESEIKPRRIRSK